MCGLYLSGPVLSSTHILPAPCTDHDRLLMGLNTHGMELPLCCLFYPRWPNAMGDYTVIIRITTFTAVSILHQISKSTKYSADSLVFWSCITILNSGQCLELLWSTLMTTAVQISAEARDHFYTALYMLHNGIVHYFSLRPSPADSLLPHIKELPDNCPASLFPQPFLWDWSWFPVTATWKLAENTSSVCKR